MEQRVVHLMAVVILIIGVGAGTQAKLTSEERRQAETLIKQFSAPESAARQRAAEKLGAMSPDVVPLVQRIFATTTDNEVKRHCRMALKAIVKKHGADAVLVRALWHARVTMMAVGSRETAGEGLLAVVQEAPNSRYSDDALLYVGQCFVMAKAYPEAIRAFEAVIQRYPRGVLVVNGNWFATKRTMSLLRWRVPKPLFDDALKAVRLYEKYLEAYPERTCDVARYRLATVYSLYLDDAKRAKEVLAKIPQVPIRESRILGYQDQIFREHLDRAILGALRPRSAPYLQLQPRHTWAQSVREFRLRLGMTVEEDRSGESDEALRREAEVRVDAFMKENMPEFQIGEVIRQEELAREEKRKRAEREKEEFEAAYLKALKTLEDPTSSSHARCRAVLVVGRARRPGALPLLLGQLDRKKFEGVVVQNTMRALGTLRDKGAVPHLLKYLDGTTVVLPGDVEMVQKNAISALGKIGDRSVLPRLREYLNSKYESVRVSAGIAVARLKKLKQ